MASDQVPSRFWPRGCGLTSGALIEGIHSFSGCWQHSALCGCWLMALDPHWWLAIARLPFLSAWTSHIPLGPLPSKEGSGEVSDECQLQTENHRFLEQPQDWKPSQSHSVVRREPSSQVHPDDNGDTGMKTGCVPHVLRKHWWTHLRVKSGRRQGSDVCWGEEEHLSPKILVAMCHSGIYWIRVPWGDQDRGGWKTAVTSLLGSYAHHMCKWTTL